MKLVLIQNKCFHDFSGLYSFEDVIEFRPAPEIDSNIKDNNIIENIEFDEIINRIERFDENIGGIVLSNWLTGINEVKNDIFHSAYELATYIRLSNRSVRYLPILILSKIRIEDILRYSISEPYIIRASYGTRIINPEVITWGRSVDDEEDEFGKEEPVINYLDKIFDVTPYNIKKQYHSQIGGRIVVTDSATSGHDIANQWGAFRMAQIAGLDMSEFSHPKTLYFKYLLSNIRLDNKPNPSNCKPFHEGDLNILFIDDNFDKGWAECLESVFIKNILKKGSVVIDPSTELGINHLQNIFCDTYDLIILDYYLRDNEKGIYLLNNIKAINPIIPVIMFTASNKAWNMDELYEAGADGYYVKEHPETAHDPEFSIKNFESFHKTIKKCLDKGALLRPYWRNIQKINNDSISIINNKIDNNGNKQLNKERINERLVMFLGLLKKGFEQTEFDENTFFYSERELAFLTLWSALNEIQEAYYEKTQPELRLTDSSGRNYTHHVGASNHFPITYLNLPHIKHYRWRYKNDTFIEYEYKLRENNHGRVQRDTEGLLNLNSNQYSSLFYNTKNQTYSISASSVTKVNYENTLHTQIAFLLLKMNAKCSLLTYLADLNSVRNKLYLAHGEDSSSLNFAVEYEDQRKSDEDWKVNIEQLFEIVYFLCIGEECIWNNPK